MDPDPMTSDAMEDILVMLVALVAASAACDALVNATDKLPVSSAPIIANILFISLFDGPSRIN
jgi:hypothetical protein